MKLFVQIFFLTFITACHLQPGQADVLSDETVTPVTVASSDSGVIHDFIDLNATSTFLKKSYIKASTNGYITSAEVSPGILVRRGQHLFTLKTKESQSLGNTINLLDSSFKFSGNINIAANAAGYLSEINHQVGDYVQEGEQLAVINERNSFVFILNLPYELRPYVAGKQTLQLILPDSTTVAGQLGAEMHTVDSASQTQNYLIKVNKETLPANLIARVRIEKKISGPAISLPAQCVLSNEIQTEYWVMKITDSTHAVKVAVTPGINTGDRIQILQPAFSTKDLFVLTGNYGLADTANIRITGKAN